MAKGINILWLVHHLGPLELVCKISLQECQSTKNKVESRDLVIKESLIKQRATTKFNYYVGSIDVEASEPLRLPQWLRKNRAWNPKEKGYEILSIHDWDH